MGEELRSTGIPGIDGTRETALEELGIVQKRDIER
jgi:hypothetical protein